MAASREDIRRWFIDGKTQGATHMIVVCDTFDHEDYPVYVKPGEDVRKKTLECSEAEFSWVMEVYSLNQDMESQLNERRAFHFD